MSCAELKLVTVRVASPRHRSTVEERGLRAGAGGWLRVGHQQEEKGAEFAKPGGTSRVRGQKTQVAFGLQSSVGNEATCLAQLLTIASSFSPLGLSRLLTLIDDN